MVKYKSWYYVHVGRTTFSVQNSIRKSKLKYLRRCEELIYIVNKHQSAYVMFNYHKPTVPEHNAPDPTSKSPVYHHQFTMKKLHKVV